MGIWKSRIGKSINAMKKNGLCGGTRQILNGLLALRKQVEPGDILFVTGGTGRSADYRCHNQAEELNLHGLRASVTMQDDKKLPEFVDVFKVFIFHRVVVNKKIENFIDKIKRQDKTVVFETDDLNYDPKHLKETDYFQNINELEKKQIENGIGAEILFDEYVKDAVVSTSFLAEKLRQKGKRVFVSKNKLSQEEVELGKKTHANLAEEKDQAIKIGYFSGTPSHDRDFSTVEKTLARVLDSHPSVKLFVVGSMKLGGVLEGKSEQIEKVPFASMEKHFKNIAGVELNIVPLENNDFCAAKSELKFFEAGIVGVPTIAQHNQTFDEAIADGETGFLANGEDEWEEKLELLIGDEKLRKRIGENARKIVLEKHTTKSQGNREYYNFLKSKIENG